MKTIFNNRPLFFIFVGIVAGIFVGGEFITSNNNVAIIFLAFVITLFVILGITSGVVKNFNIFKTSLICLLSVMLGASLICCSFGFKLNQISFNEQTECKVVGKIENFSNDKNDYTIKIGNLSFNNKNFKGKIIIKLNDVVNNKPIKIGNIISFDGVVYKNAIIKDNKFDSNVVNNQVYYKCKFDANLVSIKNGDASFLENIKIVTKQKLNSCMDVYASDICYALLFGDKSNVDSNIYNYYSYSGVGHILSVSGLHIGFIVAMIVALFKILKVKNLTTFFATFAILLCYCCLCDFTASVVRASVMSLCLIISTIVGKKADSVSSLCFAGVLLLLLNPFNFYSLGFRLSFSAVFGILFLTKPLIKLLRKIHIPYKICISFAVTIASTLFTLPFVSNTFKFIAPISIISNLIVLPLFAVLFCMLFVSFLINLLLPFAFLFVPINYFLGFITFLVNLFSAVPTIKLVSFSKISTIIYFACITTFSKFLLINFKSKIIIASCIAVVFCSSLTFFNQEQFFNSYKVISFSGNSSFLITTNDNTKILVSLNDYNQNNLLTKLCNNNIKHINYMIVPKYDIKNEDNISTIANRFKVENLLLPTNLDSTTILSLNNKLYSNKILTETTFDNLPFNDNLTLNTIYDNDNLLGVKIKLNLNNVLSEYLIVNKSLTTSQATTILENTSSNLKLLICNYESAGVKKICTENKNVKLYDKMIQQNSICYSM